TLDAFENQDYQFEDLVEKLSVNRDAGRNPVFDVMFVLRKIESAPGNGPAEESSLKSEPLAHEARTSKFDLTLHAVEGPENLSFTFEYCTKLFKMETIERFTRYFKTVACIVSDSPGGRISEIDILSPAERRQLLMDFNMTGSVYPKDSTIDELFQQQVEARPDEIAVVYEENCITYKDLDKKAGELAGFLRIKGVDTDVIVSIMADHSLEMFVGIISILKAGGAYLPINPQYPEQRKKFLLTDAGVKLLLTNCNCAGLPVEEVIRLDIPHLSGAVSPVEKMHGAGHLSYVMYTSGSTGNPKGIMVTHRNVVRLVKNTNYIQLSADERLMQSGALEFDASTFEIWGALLNGFSLYPVSRDTVLNPQKVKEIIHKNRVTTVWMTSPLFNQFVHADIEIFAGLRNLLVGGDVLSPLHIGKVREKYPRLNVINGYGPTENTTFSTTHLIEEEYVDNIPIGKPIANSAVYILDRGSRLVPPGTIGELCTGGDGVARGYLNNPELTHEKFIINPFIEGERIYKTGDLARWLPDGTIKFIGRLDHQVKIRGFRIELEEIENRLLTHGQIKEVVVMAKEAGAGRSPDVNSEDKYLIGYIVMENDLPSPLTASQLREYLSKRLPDYMIPAHFVPLDRIPLTPNGKIDKKALASLDTVPGMLGTGVEYAAPENDVEEIIAAAWKEVLNVAKVGVNDNFFDLGGNSMYLLKVGSKLRETFKKEIPVVELFQYPTIRSLTRYLNPRSGVTAADNPGESSRQLETLDEGKNRMKRFVKRTRKNSNG
ncbi:MAG: amino acid adenylation domain-containing protein, partial [bacterium]|nr:amino acid adenylation domain-containing protein [bacterium]